MDIPATLTLLPDVERRFDVWSWEAAGVRYWPLIRAMLRGAVLGPISAKPVFPPASDRGAAPPLPSAPPLDTLPPDAFVDRAGALFADLPDAADILFLARESDEFTQIGGLSHDRMIDPILEIARDMGLRVVKIRTARGQPVERPSAHPAPVFQFDRIASLNVSIPILPEIDALNAYLRERVDFSIEQGVVRSLIKRTAERKLIAGALLDRVRPRAAMLAVFDDPLQMALVAACRARGVPVADIQHGKQGADHITGAPWENMPPEGSPLLPDWFWVWGERTYRQIEAAFAGAGNTHRPLLGGNALLARWKSGAYPPDPQVAGLRGAFADAARRILVCLQPIAEPLPAALMQAMAASPPDWAWWIRLHPKQADAAANIARRIAATGARFEIEAASAAPLYSLLTKADHHVTGWSTVAFEAEALGCPTTLCHPVAESVMAEEIAERRFAYAATGRELLACIEAAPVAPDLPPYFLADEGAARRALTELMGGGG